MTRCERQRVSSRGLRFGIAESSMMMLVDSGYPVFLTHCTTLVPICVNETNEMRSVVIFYDYILSYKFFFSSYSKTPLAILIGSAKPVKRRDEFVFNRRILSRVSPDPPTPPIPYRIISLADNANTMLYYNISLVRI